jgi:hypothetical protein
MLRWVMRPARPVLLALLLFASGCQSDPDTIDLPLTPTEATTERFSGTVGVGGSAINQFTVLLSGGLLTVTLTAAGPPSNVVMGITVGRWDGTTCSALQGGTVPASAGSAPQIAGNVDAGRYCLSVFDVGNLSAAVTFNATVTHY